MYFTIIAWRINGIDKEAKDDENSAREPKPVPLGSVSGREYNANRFHMIHDKRLTQDHVFSYHDNNCLIIICAFPNPASTSFIFPTAKIVN